MKITLKKVPEFCSLALWDGGMFWWRGCLQNPSSELPRSLTENPPFRLETIKNEEKYDKKVLR